MIVRHSHDRLQLITQPDHAHLARRIMEHCVPLANRARRAAILRAIAEHDNGWAEADASPAVNAATGTIVDFVNAPLSVRHSVWPRAIARLADDPWVAALVAQHALTAYAHYRSETRWSSFFAEMEVARNTMLRATPLQLDELLDDYSFVRLGDLISLVFCTGSTSAVEFGQWTVQLSGTDVDVRPDVFGGEQVQVEIDAREIPNKPFRSDGELGDALGKADTITLRGMVSGA